MKATLEYFAAGGNRHSSAADWTNSLLAFGAGHNIALWNPDDERKNGIKALLAGHSDTVNAVKICREGPERLILSGGADKTIRIWKATDANTAEFQQSQCLTDHTSSINTIAILPEANIFVSGSADATLKVWQLQSATAKLIQSISLKPRYLPLALALTSLPNGDMVLAAAGTSNVIQLYARSISSGTFELQAALTGHEGWIRSLDFTRETKVSTSDILLASASQDKYIRLWRFRSSKQSRPQHSEITNELSSTAAEKSLSNKAHQVGSPQSRYSVTFEALLIGHEDWIYTVRWQPADESTTHPALLSASADNSLAIWKADSVSGLWVCNSRLGEISSQKGSTTATGSTGGFWIGLWQPQGSSVVSLGRTGSWRKWNFEQTHDIWVQQVGIGGHVQGVQGLAWSPCGRYVLSTSPDQTTRLVSEWIRKGLSSWHEVARPQIHGYDLNCIDTITETRFISGADEKLLRVFNKPKAIANLLTKLTGRAGLASENLPDAANIPVLGLSNKAVAAVDDEEQTDVITNEDINERDAVNPASIVRRSTLDLDHPPLEDHLARNTLWPEHEKLYGHGYEISAVTTSHNGSLVATACKASSINHAVIRLYETQEWRELRPALTAHSLTVTGLAFSPDDRFLLSVGRDRQWTVFERKEGRSDDWMVYCSDPKGHSRMILDCSWAPIEAGHVFATAGRDKFVKVWRLSKGTANCVSTISTGAPVTAMAFACELAGAALQLSYGTEAGNIALLAIDKVTLVEIDRSELDVTLHPSRAVKALRWRPRITGTGKTETQQEMQLAAASDDYSLRIFNVVL